LPRSFDSDTKAIVAQTQYAHKYAFHVCDMKGKWKLFREQNGALVDLAKSPCINEEISNVSTIL